jgi:acetyl esterase/lipase
MTRLAALLLLASLPAVAGAAAPPPRAVRDSVADGQTRPAKLYSVRQFLDLRYYNGSSRQRLDVFAPRGSASERFPVVLFVHGGTWMIGDKNFFGIYRGVGLELARHGVVAVLINYRLSPQVKHPEHVKDVARAFAWVVRNIDRYGGDPGRIILAGHSAGAHLASLLATDEQYLEDPALKLTPRHRKAIKGVIAVSGIYRVPPPDEFRAMVARMVRIVLGDPARSTVARFLSPALRAVAETVNPFAVVFGTARDVQTKASPLSHVHKGLSPFLLLVAEAEVPRLHDMAREFAAALRKAGTTVTLAEIDGCTHRSIVNRLHDGNHEATRMVLDFIHRHAAPPPRGGS